MLCVIYYVTVSQKQKTRDGLYFVSEPINLNSISKFGMYDRKDFLSYFFGEKKIQAVEYDNIYQTVSSANIEKI